MWPRPPFDLRLRITFIALLAAITVRPAHSSGATDYFRAGRQAWLEKDWSAAIRQFSLVLDDSLPSSRRADALFYRADALLHVHDCARAADDVATLRALGSTSIDARRSAKLQRSLADCEPGATNAPSPARTLPLLVRLYGGAHRYSAAGEWTRSWGAELAVVPGPLQGFVRGGWIGTNDYAGELGLRLAAPPRYRLRPWVEGSAGLERLRPGGGFVLSFTFVEWDSFTTTFGATSPQPSFHGTSLGLGVGLDVPLSSFLGVGAACRWRNIHWKSDRPATLPGDDRELVAYLFAR